jgi:DNA-binding Lrp family transcriptional regulator
MELDNKDIKILEILKEDGSLTSKEISKIVNMPITTVHHRIKKLKENGIIKRYTIELDYEKLNYPVSAYILIEVDYDQLKKENITQHELIARFKKYDEITQAEIITGEMDIIIKVRTKTIKQLDNFIVRILRNINGIHKTKTILVLNEGQTTEKTT